MKIICMNHQIALRHWTIDTQKRRHTNAVQPRGMVFTEVWLEETPGRGGGGSWFGLATTSCGVGVEFVGFLSVSSSTDSSSSDNWLVAKGE